jgi:sulfur carrier protein ThiS
MIVEVNGAFRTKVEISSRISMNVEGEMKVKEIVHILGIENAGYAIFFINDRQSGLEDVVNNNDKLTILPLIDGG